MKAEGAHCTMNNVIIRFQKVEWEIIGGLSIHKEFNLLSYTAI